MRLSHLRWAISAALIAGAGFAGNGAAQVKESKAVDEIFSDLAVEGSPGCALAVARDGKTIYEKGYGLANVEENVAITPHTVFDIGSTSKQFTAASILLLEKQGKLALSDDIRKFLPEIPDYGHTITILHLLNHTSGIRDYLTLFELAGVNIDGVTTDDDALAIIAQQKALNFEPGSEWLYSNSGFFLLSVIVKRASGKSLREFAAENIFAPLDMKQTVFRDEHTQLIPERALAYDAKENGPGFALNVSYFEQTGDGAVHTSVEDLLKWDHNFYQPKVGGTAFVKELQEQGKLNNGKILDYAKGLSRGTHRGLPYVDHGGSWGGYRAQLLRFPEQTFSVACLCNLGSADPDRRAFRVADIFLAGQLKPAAEDKSAQRGKREKKATVELTAGQLAGFAGKFASEELRATYLLQVADSRLKLVRIQSGDGFVGTAPGYELRPIGTDEFVADQAGVEFKFLRDGAGQVRGFRVDAGRTKGIEFQRK
jgi:CubicO group peptidase (beta-lactamase class C family)